MTSYWIDLVECQRLVNDLRTLLETVRDDFDKTPDNLEGMRESLCASDESNIMEDDTHDLDDRLVSLVEEDLVEHFDGIVDKLTLRVNSMQEVINYYAFGDAEMAHRAQGKMDEMPEFRSAGEPAGSERPEYIPGHPARGLAGNPGDSAADPAFDGAMDPEEILTEDVATETPYDFVTEHPVGNDSDGR